MAVHVVAAAAVSRRTQLSLSTSNANYDSDDVV